ncbi:MAG: T9SS type A sorting domain-containing protein [Bacteroidia bacterium]|nr:T9SS type A sorting domain-containing protein [Bacteroidia bacterium]
MRNTSATISANSFVPKIDFILNTTMMQQDTFVMVDISNPRPDSIKWTVPSNIILLNGPFVNSPILVCGDTGSFYIKAKAYFNNCIDSLTKLVRFIKYDSISIKSGINNGIKTFSLYPNPNTGQFTVYLEFFKNQTFVIKIISSSGGEVFQSNSYNGNSATIPIQMPVSTPGNYYLRVIAEFDSKQKSFILTN